MARRARAAGAAALLLGLLVLAASPAPSAALRLFGYDLFESGRRVGTASQTPSQLDVVETHPEGLSVMGGAAESSADAASPKVRRQSQRAGPGWAAAAAGSARRCRRASCARAPPRA